MAYRPRVYGTDEVAELSGYTERAVQLIARQLGIGEKVKGRLQFTADDVDALRSRRKQNLRAQGSPILARANELISGGVERVDAFAQATTERTQ
jgi:hypothetical protein